MPVGVSAYVPLANITLSSNAASVTFSSISQAYKDLVVVGRLNATVTNSYLQSRVNNDATNKYSEVVALGISGSPVASYAYLDGQSMYFYYPSWIGTSGNVTFIANYFDYTSTSVHKNILTRGNSTVTGVDMVNHRWGSTSAITSISFYPDSGFFTAGSTFALYGISG